MPAYKNHHNLNNLFERPALFEREGFSAETTKALNDIAKLNELLAYDDYSTVSDDIVRLLSKYFSKGSETDAFVINEIRGKLFSQNADGSGVKLKVKGRKSWLGWIELLKKPVDAVATQNTGKVINTIKPDIMCAVEVDNRIALQHFNDLILKSYFAYNMLIDGNDNRGIDVGIYSRYPITGIQSHIFDTYTSNNRVYPVFSRDCPEYRVSINGSTMTMICNHLKSKDMAARAQAIKREKDRPRDQ
jgi:hypothetical protein